MPENQLEVFKNYSLQKIKTDDSPSSDKFEKTPLSIENPVSGDFAAAAAAAKDQDQRAHIVAAGLKSGNAQVGR
jgi:hypothetical protein